MTKDQIRDNVFQAIHRVAPEADPANLPPGANLREELDLDSMDFLRVITDLHERLKVDVPEADYAKLATLDACVEYLAKRLG
jgi:acyl carrier protein